MSDPSRFLDEAVVTRHDLLNLGARGHFVPSYDAPRNMKYAPGSGTEPSVAASGVKGKGSPDSLACAVSVSPTALRRRRVAR
jgi:hypothetical protein